MSTKFYLQEKKHKRNGANLSAPTITTTDLFKTQPIFARTIIPGDEFSIDHFQVNRADSLPVPAFVNVDNFNSWWYVKYEQIWQPWNAFITESYWSFNGANMQVPKAPTCNDYFWFRLFMNEPTWITAVASSATTYDLYDDTTQNPTKYVFTATGRKVYTILRLLGYNFKRYYHADGANPANATPSTPQHNLLKLIAYTTVYANFFVPEKFRATALRHLSMWKTRVDFSDFVIDVNVGETSANYTMITYVLHLFKDILLNEYYGGDYFTNSLNSPMGNNPNTGVEFEDISVPNLSGQYKSGVESSSSFGGTPVIRQGNGSSNQVMNVTSYILNLLNSVTLRTQQKALSPMSVLGRLYSMFGIKSDAKDDLPVNLATKNWPIVIYDEVSAADTRGQNTVDDPSSKGKSLGYRAGTAESTSKKEKKGRADLHFSFDDWGVLFCINQVSPNIFYWQGVHRENTAEYPYDYAIPAYQDAGYQAIASFELVNNNSMGNNNTWGFTSKQAENMSPLAILAGDFAIPSVSQGSECFHSGRYLAAEVGDPSSSSFADSQASVQNNNAFGIVNSVNVLGTPFVNHQYDRIFNITSGEFDHIQQWNYFKVFATRNCNKFGDFSIGDLGGRIDEIQGITTVHGR